MMNTAPVTRRPAVLDQAVVAKRLARRGVQIANWQTANRADGRPFVTFTVDGDWATADVVRKSMFAMKGIVCWAEALDSEGKDLPRDFPGPRFTMRVMQEMQQFGTATVVGFLRRSGAMISSSWASRVRGYRHYTNGYTIEKDGDRVIVGYIAKTDETIQRMIAELAPKLVEAGFVVTNNGRLLVVGGWEK